MFTGLVETCGTVVSLRDGVLRLLAEPRFLEGISIGESIAVNGCCLTVVPDKDGILQFDLSPETLARTSLGRLAEGSRVNLERAMRADGRFGGHIVQGHVDAAGTFVGKTNQDNSVVFRFSVPPGWDRYLIDKGSITIDGVSLTVVNPGPEGFDVWIIPHTLTHTHLDELKPGDPVNLEFDVIAKYVERLMNSAW